MKQYNLIIFHLEQVMETVISQAGDAEKNKVDKKDSSNISESASVLITKINACAQGKKT